MDPSVIDINQIRDHHKGIKRNSKRCREMPVRNPLYRFVWKKTFDVLDGKSCHLEYNKRTYYDQQCQHQIFLSFLFLCCFYLSCSSLICIQKQPVLFLQIFLHQHCQRIYQKCSSNYDQQIINPTISIEDRTCGKEHPPLDFLWYYIIYQNCNCKEYYKYV